MTPPRAPGNAQGRALRWGLRRGTVPLAPHVQAAVQLLLNHGHWLTDEPFVNECLTRTEDGAYRVDWERAAAFVAAGPGASTTQCAVLDFAVLLATNRLRLDLLEPVTGALLNVALLRALGDRAPRRRPHPPGLPSE